MNYSLLKRNDPFFSEDVWIIQLGVVNKILKDLIHKNAIFFVFALILCFDFMYNYIQIFIDITLT